MIYRSNYVSPVGELLLFADGEGLTGLRFADCLDKRCADAQNAVPGETEDIACAKAWLDLYFSGGAPDFTPRIRLAGTPFGMRVWELLRDIPYGETVAYGRIADLLAKERGLRKMSAQAVGNAVGRNPVAIIVPCHRVVGADGSLTGYGGGLWRKRALLSLEGIPTP